MEITICFMDREVAGRIFDELILVYNKRMSLGEFLEL